MPSGPGTYGSKRGRPPMKMKPGGARKTSKKPDNSAAKMQRDIALRYSRKRGKRISRSDNQTDKRFWRYWK